MDYQNNRSEFIRLIQDNKAIVFKICNSYCRNKEDREDLAQEIIFQLWRTGHSFREDQKFTTWMYRVALNVAISFYRKSKNANILISVKEIFMDPEDKKSENDDDEIEYEKKRRSLQQFIFELNELDRALIILFLEAKSYREISNIIGITETNVSTRIKRIKDKLRLKMLNKND